MDLEPFISWFQWQKGIFEQKGFRFLVVLSGSNTWAREAAGRCAKVLVDVESIEAAWLTADKSDLEQSFAFIQVASLNKGQTLLGQSLDLLVIEAFDAVVPDSIAAAIGCVKGGGAILLLVNDWHRLSYLEDGDLHRFISYGRDQLRVKSKKSAYLERLKTRFDEELVCVNELLEKEQGKEIPTSFLNIYFEELSAGTAFQLPKITGEKRQNKTESFTQDQMDAIVQINKTITGHRKRPLVIKSHRGRGKSTALGVASAQLMIERSCRILVTAPNKQGAKELFSWAQGFLEWQSQRVDLQKNEGVILKNDLNEFFLFSSQRNHEEKASDLSTKNREWYAGQLHFLPPDQVVDQEKNYDLLIVDEAAAIPTQLLTEFVHCFKRVVFATTIQGYEGNGRGFELRFEHILSKWMPQWRELGMQQPLRWSAHDPVEALVDDLFLPILDKVEVSLTGLPSIRSVTAEELTSNEPLLRQIFTLLVDAHYQTTPGDLRMLLDSHDIVLLVAFKEKAVIGACIINIEGPFSPEWSDWVVNGGRKLRGHLLPQALIFQYGQLTPLMGVMGRVVRIAVRAEVRREGIGTLLLKAAFDMGNERGWSAIGASYGSSNELLRFWMENGFALFRMSIGKDSASGEYSALVLNAIEPDLRKLIYDPDSGLTNRFTEEYLFNLPILYQNLDAKIILLALKQGYCQQSSDVERQNIIAKVSRYQQGFLPFELAHLSLQKWFISWFPNEGAINDKGDFIEGAELVVAKVLQHKSWKECGQQFHLTGRKMVEARIREWLGAALTLN